MRIVVLKKLKTNEFKFFRGTTKDFSPQMFPGYVLIGSFKNVKEARENVRKS